MTFTLVCALAAEERAAADAAVPVARVGLRASAPLPEGPLVSFGLAGALRPGLVAGALLTAGRIVDERGETLWEGVALPAPGARTATLCAARRVIDDPDERAALAAATGADAVDLESGRIAVTGRLVGAVKAVSDTPARRLGRLARGATPQGDVAWGPVLGAFALEPGRAVRAARDARHALAALERAAASLGRA